ncbi:ubiquinone biosynthesis regulatory protein kinase UbiB [Spartinivicinus poritis]|uniref:Probable protein kinase UbiB n=1 Tax=Spartinivicinus poritis TaxID=2994640 RepID=A0ABT5U8G2_9GAMM|nr:ubiquinone biosynthesis regulatory protein kinase UbiB [Spartinivicinus sp. A2-2]MDE1461728.1 ubiquinone biosynthesis regulatory protein kinase UbiB [Spartinivicinus sp. A2-2]
MVQLLRLFKIIHVVAKYRLDELVYHPQLPWYLRFALLLLPWRWIKNPAPRAERLRKALEELGPIFVKFGQLLSTRRDLLPDDVANELKKLQDQVPPFSGELATKLIEQNLGKAVGELFAEFDPKPMASASVAQVHLAKLPDGKQVVVKVIRPGINKIIKQDMTILYFMAKLLVAFSTEGRRLRPVEVVADYEHTIFDELDLQREAANASQLRRNFANSDLLYVPQVFWDYCSRSVMVMERIYGIPVAEIDQLKAHGIDMQKLAVRGVEIFFTQVFRDSFFHADMHPGNIFVSPHEPETPQYIAIDCGIVGSLTAEDQSYLARNLLAFFNQDYRQVAQLHIDSGWVPKNTRVNELESAIRAVCEPIFEKPLKDISFGQVLLRLFQTARRFNMEVQPQLVLLQKTLLNIEGLGRQLYPDLDLWHTGKPFLEQWMKDRVGPLGVLKHIHQRAPEWLEQAPIISQNMLQWLEQRAQEPTQITKQPPTTNKRYLIGLLLVAGSAASLIWPDWTQLLNQANLPSMVVGVVGIYLILSEKKT